MSWSYRLSSGSTEASTTLSTWSVDLRKALSISVTSPESLISTTVVAGITVTGCAKVLPVSPSPLPPAKRFIITSRWQGSIHWANSRFSVTT